MLDDCFDTLDHPFKMSLLLCGQLSIAGSATLLCRATLICRIETLKTIEGGLAWQGECADYFHY